MGCTKVAQHLAFPLGKMVLCSNRAQAKFCRAQNGAQNKKSRKAALLKAPFPHFLFQLVQGGQRSSQSFAAAKRQQNPALLVNKASQGGSAVALPRRAQLHICGTTLSKRVRMAHIPQLFIKAKVPLSRHFCKYISPNRSCRKEKWRWYRFSAARSIAERPPSGFHAFGCGHRVRVCRRVRLSCFRQSGACRHRRGGA